VTEPSGSTLKLLGQTLDIDAHAMAPSHLWGHMFGEAAARVAELAERVLKKTCAIDYPHIEGGTDVKRKFVNQLTPLGEDTMQKFCRTNSELLLPSQAVITSEPTFA